MSEDGPPESSSSNQSMNTTIRKPTSSWPISDKMDAVNWLSFQPTIVQSFKNVKQFQGN